MDVRSVLQFSPLGILQAVLPTMASCGERVPKDGIIANRAVLIAIGVDWEGRRQVLAVDIANREEPIELDGFFWKD